MQKVHNAILLDKRQKLKCRRRLKSKFHVIQSGTRERVTALGALSWIVFAAIVCTSSRLSRLRWLLTSADAFCKDDQSNSLGEAICWSYSLWRSMETNVRIFMCFEDEWKTIKLAGVHAHACFFAGNHWASLLVLQMCEPFHFWCYSDLTNVCIVTVTCQSIWTFLKLAVVIRCILVQYIHVLLYTVIQHTTCDAVQHQWHSTNVASDVWLEHRLLNS